ncbi:hypothetical protein K1719_007252 [Acacia pycnantha]|nr:hypothetical protein K1719_007252 [Acacia pycnantha]
MMETLKRTVSLEGSSGTVKHHGSTKQQSEKSFGLVDVFPTEDRKSALHESLAEINMHIEESQNSGGMSRVGRWLKYLPEPRSEVDKKLKRINKKVISRQTLIKEINEEETEEVGNFVFRLSRLAMVFTDVFCITIMEKS